MKSLHSNINLILLMKKWLYFFQNKTKAVRSMAMFYILVNLLNVWYNDNSFSIFY